MGALKLTADQIGLILDIESMGPISGLLFSPHRRAGSALREAGLLAGQGDGVHLTKAGRAAAEEARTAS